MQTTVEIILVFCVLANLIKCGDLLLRPHQQKWLQEKVDTMALYLDYSRPLNWYRSVKSNNKILSVAFSIACVGQYSMTFVLPFTAGARIVSLILIVFGILGLIIRPSNESIKPARKLESKDLKNVNAFALFLRDSWRIKWIDWIISTESTGTHFFRALISAVLGISSIALLYFTIWLTVNKFFPFLFSLPETNIWAFYILGGT